jgi:hypothetical protein
VLLTLKTNTASEGAASKRYGRDVHVAGKRVVADGRHGSRDRIAAEFQTTLKHLLAR